MPVSSPIPSQRPRLSLERHTICPLRLSSPNRTASSLTSGPLEFCSTRWLPCNRPSTLSRSISWPRESSREDTRHFRATSRTLFSRSSPRCSRGTQHSDQTSTSCSRCLPSSQESTSSSREIISETSSPTLCFITRTSSMSSRRSSQERRKRRKRRKRRAREPLNWQAKRPGWECTSRHRATSTSTKTHPSSTMRTRSTSLTCKRRQTIQTLLPRQLLCTRCQTRAIKTEMTISMMQSRHKELAQLKLQAILAASLASTAPSTKKR